MNIKKTILLLGTALFSAGYANASVTTYIDFHDGNGTPGVTGWNMVQLFTDAIPPSPLSGGTLNADDGSSDLSIGNIQIANANRGFNSNHDTTANGDPALPSWLAPYEVNAPGDSRWMIDNDDGETLSLAFDLTGFTSGQTVNISIWAGRYDNGSDLMDVTVNGGFSDGNVSDGFNYGRNGLHTDIVLNWTGIVVPVDETITVNMVSNAGSRRIGINAMQIEVIPEPSSLILIGVFGLAGFALLRRRT